MEGFEYYRRTPEEIEADLCEGRLRGMLDARPELQGFIIPGAITSAKNAFQQIDQFTRAHPRFMSGIALSQQTSQGNVGVTIVPAEGNALVFVTTDHGTVAMSPVMSCTYRAITEILEERDLQGKAYVHLTSPSTLSELVDAAVESADNGNPVVNYERGSSPVNYVAMAALLFENEVFKKEIEL